MAGLLLMLAACSTASNAPTPSARTVEGVSRPYSVNGVRYVPHADPDYNSVGLASWYGRRFHGRHTANGERFDMNGMTAAHKTLPFGTMVRVTNILMVMRLLIK